MVNIGKDWLILVKMLVEAYWYQLILGSDNTDQLSVNTDYLSVKDD